MTSKGSKLEPGDKIAGRYRLVKKLGEGGMGTIWEVYNENVERAFAIKVLSAKMARDPLGVQRFLEEAKAAGRIRHPGVVEVLDAGKLEERRGGLPYMVMEKLDGEGLDKRLRRGPLSIEGALRTVRDAALGVQAAHEAGVVHRDIKPANLFLHRPPDAPPDAPDVVKVLDFGISKSKREGDLGLTGTGVLIGTPSFMSPEQIQGNIAEPPSDVWALGVVLYACLTARLPFSGGGDDELLENIVTTPYAPLPDDIPAEIATIVDACLSKRAGHRPPSAKSLAARIEAALAPLSVHVGRSAAEDHGPRVGELTAPGSRAAPAPAAASLPAAAASPGPSRKLPIAPILAGGLGLSLVLGIFALTNRREAPAAPEVVAPAAEPPPTLTEPASAPSAVDLGSVDEPPGGAPDSKGMARPARPPRRPARGQHTPSPPPPAPPPPAAAHPPSPPPVDPLRKPGF